MYAEKLLRAGRSRQVSEGKEKALSRLWKGLGSLLQAGKPVSWLEPSLKARHSF